MTPIDGKENADHHRREKELRHRDDLSEEERTELVALEDARKAERQREYQARRQQKLAGK